VLRSVSKTLLLALACHGGKAGRLKGYQVEGLIAKFLGLGLTMLTALGTPEEDFSLERSCLKV
jgi:hypothetical protein